MLLRKLKINDAQRLNEQEMKMFKGGSNLTDYCCTLMCLAIFNYSSWSSGAREGFEYGFNLCYDNGFTGTQTCHYEGGC